MNEYVNYRDLKICGGSNTFFLTPLLNTYSRLFCPDICRWNIQINLSLFPCSLIWMDCIWICWRYDSLSAFIRSVPSNVGEAFVVILNGIWTSNALLISLEVILATRRDTASCDWSLYIVLLTFTLSLSLCVFYLWLTHIPIYSRRWKATTKYESVCFLFCAQFVCNDDSLSISRWSYEYKLWSNTTEILATSECKIFSKFFTHLYIFPFCDFSFMCNIQIHCRGCSWKEEGIKVCLCREVGALFYVMTMRFCCWVPSSLCLDENETPPTTIQIN